MIFTNQNIIGIYNIIFHIINILLKIGIQMTFRFYTNYYEVNINHIYHLILLKIKSDIEIIYNRYFNTTDLNRYV
jgi:hypothetical protein